MDSGADRVRMDIDGAIATITLVRLAQLNAFDVEMHHALAEAFGALAANENVRALVLTGEGRAFSSGQDLQERAAAFAAGAIPDIHGSLDTLYNPLIERIANSPIPVIAAVNGMAFGAGAAVAIACDVTIAARSARFQFGFINVGLGPDSGASWTLPRLVGLQRAMDLALSGRPVDALEAERIGLVARCVEDEQLMPEALTLAKQLADRSSHAVRAIKRRMRGTALADLSVALSAERDAQAELGRTPEYREAVLRFAARGRG